MATNLLNPKVGVFYLASLPQFIPAGYSPVVMGSALALIHALMCLVWLTVIILGARAARRFLATPRALRLIDAISGLVIIAFGLNLAAKSRL